MGGGVRFDCRATDEFPTIVLTHAHTRTDSPRRKRATEGSDYFCEAPKPSQPPPPRFSRRLCALQIILLRPRSKSCCTTAAAPSDLCLITHRARTWWNAFPMSPNVSRRLFCFQIGGEGRTCIIIIIIISWYIHIYITVVYTITKCANAKSNKTRKSLALVPKHYDIQMQCAVILACCSRKQIARNTRGQF